MKKLSFALIAALAMTSIASAGSISRYELRVRNDASSGIRNVQVRDVETDTYLGDRLVGRIPPNTAATIDLTNNYDSCRMKVEAVLYDGRTATKFLNVCTTNSLTISDGDEFE